MKTNTKEKSYTEQVVQGRIDIMEEIEHLSKLEEPQDHEDYREPLSIDTRIEKKILLSWGGPEDGFKLYFNTEGELLDGVYYRADWGEYKETDLSAEEAETVFNFYMGGVYQ